MYETQRLILRNWQDSDIDPFFAINQDKKVMEFFPKLYSKEETAEFVEKYKAHLLQFGYTFFACELKSSGSFVGFVGIKNVAFEAEFAPCVEIGWRLDSKYWGQGIAVEAAIKCLDLGFNKFNFNRIVSFTPAANVKSERVMQKLGMTHYSEQNFLHPNLDRNHPLALHILYKINKHEFIRKARTDEYQTA